MVVAQKIHSLQDQSPQRRLSGTFGELMVRLDRCHRRPLLIDQHALRFGQQARASDALVSSLVLE